MHAPYLRRDTYGMYLPTATACNKQQTTDRFCSLCIVMLSIPSEGQKYEEIGDLSNT